MRFVRSTSLILLALATPALAQQSSPTVTVCTNETVAAISSRGIKIGATFDDVLNLLGKDEKEKERIRNGVSDSYKSVGFISARVEPSAADTAIDGRFVDIASYELWFLDEKLNGFRVNYSKPKWKNPEQFADAISTLLRLPEFEPQKALQCGDYKIRAVAAPDAAGNLTVSDERLDKVIRERDERYKDEKRAPEIRRFKP